MKEWETSNIKFDLKTELKEDWEWKNDERNKKIKSEIRLITQQ
jgi:hypothetical protein